MEDRLIASRQRRERVQEYKDAAAKGCYSLIIIVVALILLRPVMVDQILSLASAYSNAGLLDESVRECDKALLIDGDSSKAWCQSARLHTTRGDREMAYIAYRRAVELDPSNPSAGFELATMYVEDGRYALAIPYLEKVRRLGPDKATIYGTPRTSYHRTSLEMLILCYEKESDAANLELVLKEARLFYPDCKAANRRSDPPKAKTTGDR